MNKSYSKKELTEYCRSMLYGITPINYEFLTNELFPMHPEWEQKKGCGVKDILIIDTKYGNKCFVIHRIDDTKTDISFTKCITNPSKIFQVKCALRSAVRPEIEAFREKVKFGVDRCIFTGDILERHNTHIDHYDYEFNDLANAFIIQEGLDNLYKQIKPSKDNVFEIIFSSLLVIMMFRRFHNENTKLRAISKKANLSSKIRKA